MTYPVKYDITLSGEVTQAYLKVKSALNRELYNNQYPLKVVEKKEANTMKVQYREEVISFSNDSIDDGISQMKALLLKINPKTGKICRCTNCHNCPSKRLNQA